MKAPEEIKVEGGKLVLLPQDNAIFASYRLVPDPPPMPELRMGMWVDVGCSERCLFIERHLHLLRLVRESDKETVWFRPSEIAAVYDRNEVEIWRRG